MNLLAIETTGSSLGLTFLQENRGRIQCRTKIVKSRAKQSDDLIPSLEKFIRTLNISVKDVDVWAVDMGPGSFTGVRVGVSVGRAVAQTLNVPLIGISSLEAIAARVKTSSRPTLISAIRPAVAGEVYGALYLKIGDTLETILAPAWLPEEDFEKNRNKTREKFKKIGFLETREEPHPEAIARLAQKKLARSSRGTRFSFEAVVPMYLQPSWAERSKKVRASGSR
jgi:tRNA threonylcarbamoyladenosine biosynthesis protein TsaB